MSSDPRPDRSGADVPQLRAVLAWTTVVGLCLATALGISAILGASLDLTATRLAGTGVACGLYGLFAVGAATLYQRSPALRVAALAGIAASVIAAAILVAAEWGASVSSTVARIDLVAGVLSFAFGLSGFLLSQQRSEDPRSVTALTFVTVLLAWLLAGAATIELIFVTGSATGPQAAGVQFPLSGLGFERFLGVTSLLTLLGVLVLPIVRRAHPAYRGGHTIR